MNNRRKGHDLERQVVRDLSPFFKYCKTARASSKMLDDSGIDINFVPFLIQCKSGYNKNRPKFEEEHKNIKLNISKNFPESNLIHQMPVILIHKINTGRGHQKKEENTQVTISYDFFIYLLNNIKTETIEQWPILSL